MTTRLANVFIMMAMLVVAAAALPAKAVVLTFYSGDGVTGNTSLVTYGDNVASGSQDGFTYYNLGEGWAPDVSLNFNVPGYGTLQWYQDGGTAPWGGGVVWSTGRMMEFTPSALASVKINDIDIVGYGDGFSLDRLAIVDAATFDFGSPVYLDLLVASSTPIIGNQPPVTGSNQSAERFTVNYTGAPGQALGIIELDSSGGNVGYESVRFSEMIPEPASLGLLGLGSLALLRRKRR